MHILPKLNSILHLIYHPSLIQTIIPLPKAAPRTVAEGSLNCFGPVEDCAFVVEEWAVVEVHVWTAGSVDGHPLVVASGGVVELGYTHCVRCASVLDVLGMAKVAAQIEYLAVDLAPSLDWMGIAC